ncbi:hypothetical protein AB7M59_008452 [Bradyrhizobium elkanii]
MFGLPGWLKVRFIGATEPGAVLVEGGAENVREPREPPPPTRASAAETVIITGSASAIATAIARTIPRVRCEKFMLVSSKDSPAWGNAPKMGRAG